MDFLCVTEGSMVYFLNSRSSFIMMIIDQWGIAAGLALGAHRHPTAAARSPRQLLYS